MSELVKLSGGPRDGEFVYVPDAPRFFPVQSVVLPSPAGAPLLQHVDMREVDPVTGCRVLDYYATVS